MKKFRRILVGGLATLVILLGGLAVAAYLLIDVERIKGEVLREVSRNLGKEVSAGTPSIMLWPTLGVRLPDLAIHSGEGFRSEHLVFTREVRVGVRVMPLLSKKVEVASAALVEPRIVLEHRDGRNNWDLPKKAEPVKPAPAEGETPAATPAPTPAGPTDRLLLPEFAEDIRVDAVSLSNGSVVVLDPKGEPVTLFGAVNLEVGNLALNEQISLMFSVVPAGAEGDGVVLEGTLGPIAREVVYRELAADLTLSLERWSFAKLRRDLHEPPFLKGIEGGAEFKLRMTTGKDKPVSIAGTGQVKDFVPGKGSPWSGGFDLDTSIDLAQEALNVARCNVTLGKTKLSLAGKVQKFLSDPAVSLKALGEPLYLADLLTLAQLAANAQGKPYVAPAEVDDQPGSFTAQVEGGMAKLKTSGKLDLTRSRIAVPPMLVKNAGQALVAEWDLGLRQPMNIDITKAELAVGTSKLTAGGTINWGEKVQAYVKGEPLNLDELLRMVGMSPPPGQKLVDGPTTLLAGMNADSKGAEVLAEFSCRQNEITIPELFRKKAGVPLEVKLSGKLDGADLVIQSGSLAFGEFSTELKGRVKDWSKSRNLDLSLDMREFTVQSFNQFFSLGDKPSSQPTIKALQDSVRAYLAREVKGSVSGELHLKGPAAALTEHSVSKARLTIKDFALKDEALVKPLKRLNVELGKDGENYRLSNLLVEVGSSDLRGQAKARNLLDFANGVFEVNLQSRRIDVADFWKPAPASTTPQAQAAATPAPGAAFEVPPFMKTIQVSGNLNIIQFLMTPLEVKDITGEMRLKAGLLDFPTLRMTVFEGLYNGSAQFDLNKNPIAYKLVSDVKALNLNAFLTTMTPLKDVLKGQLNGKVELDGAGLEWEQVKRSLAGKGGITLDNAEIGTLRLFSALDSVADLIGMPDLKASGSKFDDLGMSWTLRDGKIVSDDLLAKMLGVTARGKGSMSLDTLMDYDVDLIFGEERTKAVEKKVRIPEKLKENGLLKIPVKVTGTATHPKVVPNMDLLKTFAEAKVQEAVEQQKENIQKELEKEGQKLLKGLFGK